MSDGAHGGQTELTGAHRGQREPTDGREMSEGAYRCQTKVRGQREVTDVRGSSQK